MTDLHAQAIEILKANDRGTYTVPAAGLAPLGGRRFSWTAAMVLKLLAGEPG